MKKKGFTLIELLVVIAIIAMLLAILMPALNKVKRLAQRLVCSTNLKGLGTAMIVYANDFEDEYPVQGGGYVDGVNEWKDRTFEWWDVDKVWADGGNISVGASLFLLVREADVSTKSFVCKSSDQKPYDGTIAGGDGGIDDGQELVELWDFGHKKDNWGPKNAVSYSYQLPYDMLDGKFFPADAVGPAGMALMADKNPWFDPKLIEPPTVDSDTWESAVSLLSPETGPGGDWDGTCEKWEIQVGNAYPHNREGQNALFNDGHAEFVKRPDVGYENDNIYTVWTGSVDTDHSGETDDYLRIGKLENQIGSGGPKSNRDSWLVNDDER